MLTRSAIHNLIAIAAVVVAIAIISTRAFAQADGNPVRLLASIGQNGSRGSAEPVEIFVYEWSDSEERDDLSSMLEDSDAAKLASALQEMPKKGYIRAPEGTLYDLRFASTSREDNGMERIVLGTEGYVNLSGTADRAATQGFPLTLIELHMNPDGKGEGKLSTGSTINVDKEEGSIVLEDYAARPVLLHDVRRARQR